jgi:hypothetical protein
MFSDVAKKTTVHQQTVTEKSTEFVKAFREEVRLSFKAFSFFKQIDHSTLLSTSRFEPIAYFSMYLSLCR